MNTIVMLKNKNTATLPEHCPIISLQLLTTALQGFCIQYEIYKACIEVPAYS